MNFQANKVKAVYRNGTYAGFARNHRELESLIGPRDGTKVEAFAVAVPADASHNEILAAIAAAEPVRAYLQELFDRPARWIDCSANPDALVHAKVGVRQDAKAVGPLVFTVG